MTATKSSQSRPADCEALAQQVRYLQERLAFYEGFDHLIQENVAQARELFRLASQEREAAAAVGSQSQQDAERREAHLRSELEAIATDLRALSGTLDALTRRVSLAVGESSNGHVSAPRALAEHPFAVIVHGVPSARTALSLQRFVASLPQVASVSAREFAGGVLRLEAQVQKRLQVDEFRRWQSDRLIQPLTEQPDVVEFALQPPLVSLESNVR
jgi:hypothetical protein